MRVELRSVADIKLYPRNPRRHDDAFAAYDAALAQYDVLVMPTVPSTADTLPTGSPQDVALFGRAVGKAFNVAPIDITGHPAISVPAGLLDGLPVGMMIVGKRFDDSLQIEEVEQTFPFLVDEALAAHRDGGDFAPARSHAPLHEFVAGILARAGEQARPERELAHRQRPVCGFGSSPAP